MSEFKSIKNNSSAQITEKKSKFIANVIYVESQGEAEENIKRIKKNYYDAKHNCFAYIVVEENGKIMKKSSDDGEPTGTAGAPILEILEKQQLCNVLVVVTRYFGGVLLGTGGLLRAYSSATIEALKKTDIINMTIGVEMAIQINYKDIGDFKYYLEKENIRIKSINYEENVEFIIEIPENKLDLFLEKNKEKIIKQQIKTKKYIEI